MINFRGYVMSREWGGGGGGLRETFERINLLRERQMGEHAAVGFSIASRLTN